jgi:GT2 family glycosyltransferase
VGLTRTPPRLPLGSIVVPCFNGARYLRETLDSLLAQTYPNVEIILLDDASTDATPEIAATYAGRITYVRQSTNIGQFENVNDGIRRAKGELIAAWHADDVYLPTIVEAEVAYLEQHPEVGAVFASDIFVDAEGREYGRIALPTEVRGERPLEYATVLEALLTYKNRFLVCPSAMVRRSVYAEVGGFRPAQYRNTSDLEMWLRIARRFPIAVLESHLMKYRHFHGTSSSQTYHRLRTTPENIFFIVDEYLAAGGRNLVTPTALRCFEAHRSEDRLMAAISHYIKGEMREGRAALGQVRLGVIARVNRVQRVRLIILALGLHVLLRVPRIDAVAQWMLRRWHVKGPPA